MFLLPLLQRGTLLDLLFAFLDDIIFLKSLSAKKQMTKFTFAKILIIVLSSCIIDQMTNSVESDEGAHNEPPHQDLHCL